MVALFAKIARNKTPSRVFFIRTSLWLCVLVSQYRKIQVPVKT